ncbi:MAG TPA: hypothetical protein VM934_15405 [Pyrinomonadaceae bacterium]|nr:hypothetical protein [Pyrinomonadaceae bacterium]
MDEFIDVESLKSLDSYIRDGIKHHIESRAEDFFLNLHRLDAASPEKPGSREIWLTRLKQGVPYNYLDLDKPDLWQPAAEANKFSRLMDFIETLPFKATGRMLIIYDDAMTTVPAHRDHLDPKICHEFIWFRTNLKKPFYVLNHQTDERLYVSSHSAWFDTVNQFHGSDAGEGLNFSIRVDGIFTDEFRENIPTSSSNPASMPALWARLSG